MLRQAIPAEAPAAAPGRHPLPRSEDPVAAVRAIMPLIEARAEGAEARRRLDDDVIDALVSAGVITLMVPAVLGGGEADPSVQIQVCEDMAYADGSTGWAVMASMTGLGTFSSLLPDSGVAKILESENFVVAGSVVPPGRAVADGDGYRVSGRFSFASGSAQAGWFLGGYLLCEEGGEPILSAAGKRQLLFGIVPRATIEPLGNWDVLGLVATASIDYEVADVFLAPDLLAAGRHAVRGGALYGMGLKSLPGLGHGGVVIGIARRSLDEFCTLAHEKVRPSAGLLARHEVLQDGIAKMRAELLGARAFLHDAYNRLFSATRDGRPVDDAMVADCRLASTHAAFTAARVTEWVYLNSGSTGLRDGSVIQRCFRDAHAASQHLFTGPQVYVDAGRIYLDTPGLTPAHRALMTVDITPPLT